MKTRHVLLAFTFVVLTIFLIIVVSSRSSEMSRLYPDDVVVDAGMLQTTQEPQVSADPNIDVNPAPEDTNRPQDTKPDVDIDSWEYLLANSEHNIGKYSPQVVARTAPSTSTSAPWARWRTSSTPRGPRATPRTS